MADSEEQTPDAELRRKKRIARVVFVIASIAVSAAIYRFFGVAGFALPVLACGIVWQFDIPEDSVGSRKALGLLKLLCILAFLVLGSFAFTPYLAVPVLVILIWTGQKNAPAKML